MIPASWAPNKGEASTAIDMIIANIPTPIRKNLDHPECVPLKPSMTLAIPLNRRAIPMNITKTNAVAPGYARARPAKMRTSTSQTDGRPTSLSRMENTCNNFFNTYE